MRAFQGLQTPTKKPGFCPNLWVVTRYFGKNPVSGAWAIHHQLFKLTLTLSAALP